MCTLDGSVTVSFFFFSSIDIAATFSFSSILLTISHSAMLDGEWGSEWRTRCNKCFEVTQCCVGLIFHSWLNIARDILHSWLNITGATVHFRLNIAGASLHSWLNFTGAAFQFCLNIAVAAIFHSCLNVAGAAFLVLKYVLPKYSRSVSVKSTM